MPIINWASQLSGVCVLLEPWTGWAVHSWTTQEAWKTREMSPSAHVSQGSARGMLLRRTIDAARQICELLEKEIVMCREDATVP